MTTPIPSPQEPEPLSPREKLILSQIESDLSEADPALTALSSTVGRKPIRRRLRNDHVLQAMAVLVIAIAVLPGQWLVGLLLIGIVVGPALVAILAACGSAGEKSQDPPHPEQDPG